MKKVNRFGFKEFEFDALIIASTRAKYFPTQEKIELIMQQFKKLTKDEAVICLSLINSPARNTFTFYDLLSFLNKKYKK